MPLSEAPPSIQQAAEKDPRVWIENFLRHPEDPRRHYDFWDGDKENYLWYLVDEKDGPLNPENWADINVLLFCRGGLKTFSATGISAWSVDAFPTAEGAATAPVDDQRYEVMDRFKEKVEQSGLDKKREKSKLSHQKFKHIVKDGDSTYTSYSHMKSRSAWGEGDKLRGIHGHFGVIDESQDVDEGTFSTFATEAIDRSVPNIDYFPAVFVIGTPKMANSFFHKLWNMSDKKTWDANADAPSDSPREKGAWVQQEEPDDFLPTSLQDEKQKHLDRIDELQAADEDHTETIEKLRDEIASIRDKGFTVRGWHLDQENSPMHDDASVAFKRQTYSKKKFKNEVMAEFYSPENDLIVNDDVWNALDSNLGFVTEKQKKNSTVVLGVDWGGGESEGAAKTVVTVGEHVPGEMEHDNGQIYVRQLKILDSSLTARQEREKIDTLAEQFQADALIVDEGYNGASRQVLQDEYGYDNCYGCQFGNVKKKEEIVWNRFNNEKRFFTANKTFMVQKFAEDFRNSEITLPEQGLNFSSKHDKGTKIIDQLTAPYTDRAESTASGKKRLKVISDRNDDIFDSLLYVWIGVHRIGGTRKARQIFTDMRPGYN